MDSQTIACLFIPLISFFFRRRFLAFSLFVALAVVARAQDDDAPIPDGELENARICSQGKICYFNARMNFTIDDSAETVDGQIKDGSETIPMDMVVEISADCDSTNSGWQYFRGLAFRHF